MINKKKTADDDFRLNSIKIGQGSELSDIESQIVAKVNDKTPAEIASDLGVSVRTVQRHLKRLRESGVIEKMSKRQRRKLGLPTDLRIPYYMVNPSSWVKVVTGVLPGKIESIESVNELDLIFDLIHGLETKVPETCTKFLLQTLQHLDRIKDFSDEKAITSAGIPASKLNVINFILSWIDGIGVEPILNLRNALKTELENLLDRYIMEINKDSEQVQTILSNSVLIFRILKKIQEDEVENFNKLLNELIEKKEIKGLRLLNQWIKTDIKEYFIGRSDLLNRAFQLSKQGEEDMAKELSNLLRKANE